MDIIAALKELCGKAGVSGDEFPASEAAAEMLRKYTDFVNIDKFGNVVGFIKSPKCSEFNAEIRKLFLSEKVSVDESAFSQAVLELCKKHSINPDVDEEGNVHILIADNNYAETLMLDAHIDRVGLIVTYIDEAGFLSVGACGSPDVKTLLAQSVTVHGKKDINGVVCTLPPHVQKDSAAPEIGDIRIDIGMTKDQAEQVVSLGDRITVNSEFRELNGGVVSAAAIDDRSGVCAILAALDMLKDRQLAYNLAVCFTAQEETGERGAKQTAFRVHPDKALVVDVSFGRTPDSDPKDTAEMGSGVMIGFSASLDKEMSNSLRELAVKKNIPFTCEVMPSSTGTNADAIGVERGGVKCCTLSFPIRYMHTSVETVNLNDIESTARLICEYVSGGAENG